MFDCLYHVSAPTSLNGLPASLRACLPVCLGEVDCDGRLRFSFFADEHATAYNWLLIAPTDLLPSNCYGSKDISLPSPPPILNCWKVGSHHSSLFPFMWEKGQKGVFVFSQACVLVCSLGLTICYPVILLLWMWIEFFPHGHFIASYLSGLWERETFALLWVKVSLKK
ncbi:hypothetical protein O6H91_23G051800 [Diphasiastrum complanatum]|uniref:Uncharacterized protein n=2 Tax=Diphasiastrum complanatum TaxID=34168 RepID=A0ACC2AAL6_DIPCM|nr:hypothetical protein O6H91_23G050800 [Diphasiastrum complanatum]KAJ7514602.1 hypothetical protein O6H91_23G051800 [Diphasiastrum complanatum]